MKSKTLPATGRIIRLFEHLAGYSFNLYYVKGKDMILCNYLSRIAVDNGDPDEVIPLSFNALAQYRLALDYVTESFMFSHFMVVTRSSTRSASISLPPVHGAQKGLDPDLKPESQSKSKKILLQPTEGTPMKTPARSPILGHTLTAKSPMPGMPRIPTAPRTMPPSLLNTPLNTNFPMPNTTPKGLQTPHNASHQQTPLGSQLITKTNLSPAQAASRRLI